MCKNKNQAAGRSRRTIREDYYEQINSPKAAADREKFFADYFRRARAEDNRAMQDIIVADAAVCWNMFQDEVQDFLSRESMAAS